MKSMVIKNQLPALHALGVTAAIGCGIRDEKEAISVATLFAGEVQKLDQVTASLRKIAAQSVKK